MELGTIPGPIPPQTAASLQSGEVEDAKLIPKCNRLAQDQTQFHGRQPWM